MLRVELLINMALDIVAELLKCINDYKQITRKNNSHPAIYMLHHLASEKKYVGSTENLYIRINKHKTSLFDNSHKNRNLQEVFNKEPHFLVTFIETKNKRSSN